MKNNNIIKYIPVIIISLFAGIIGTIIVYKKIPQELQTVEKQAKNITISESNTLKSAIEKIYNAVVVVETYRNNAVFSTGTGFIYKETDKEGYIITNHHVIEKGTNYKITLITGEEYEAKLLGSDEYSDVAVLSIPKEAVIQIATIGKSEETEIGDTVFTVGSPLGKDYMGTVTKGILSGKNRTVTVNSSTNNSLMLEVLQTDAAINPGNSGGPLLNINGEVIGVNSMKLIKDEVEGMGFALPIEIVTSLSEKLENGEKIERPLIGIEMSEVSNAYYLARRGIVVPENIQKGVVVINVSDDYPAKKAGLQQGDIIISINDTEITDAVHFKYLLYKYNIGDKVQIKYYRDNKILETYITLDKKAE